MAFTQAYSVSSGTIILLPAKGDTIYNSWKKAK